MSNSNYYDFEKDTKLKIFDISGALIREITKQTAATPIDANPNNWSSNDISNLLQWDRKNANNELVASGVYFIYIETPNAIKLTGKCAIIR